jgi:hypothetical protein
MLNEEECFASEEVREDHGMVRYMVERVNLPRSLCQEHGNYFQVTMMTRQMEWACSILRTWNSSQHATVNTHWIFEEDIGLFTEEKQRNDITKSKSTSHMERAFVILSTGQIIGMTCFDFETLTESWILTSMQFSFKSRDSISTLPASHAIWSELIPAYMININKDHDNPFPFLTLFRIFRFAPQESRCEIVSDWPFCIAAKSGAFPYELGEKVKKQKPLLLRCLWCSHQRLDLTEARSLHTEPDKCRKTKGADLKSKILISETATVVRIW